MKKVILVPILSALLIGACSNDDEIVTKEANANVSVVDKDKESKGDQIVKPVVKAPAEKEGEHIDASSEEKKVEPVKEVLTEKQQMETVTEILESFKLAKEQARESFIAKVGNAYRGNDKVKEEFQQPLKDAVEPFVTDDFYSENLKQEHLRLLCHCGDYPLYREPITAIEAISVKVTDSLIAIDSISPGSLSIEMYASKVRVIVKKVEGVWKLDEVRDLENILFTEEHTKNYLAFLGYSGIDIREEIDDNFGNYFVVNTNKDGESLSLYFYRNLGSF